MSFILQIWFWIIFIRFKSSLPSIVMDHPKMEYEGMSGAIFWEDEGLLERRNHHLLEAFKYVIHHRMTLIVGSDADLGYLGSKKFDKKIFTMAKKYFPNWVGFAPSRCSYNPELSDRILRMKKVANWRCDKLEQEC